MVAIQAFAVYGLLFGALLQGSLLGAPKPDTSGGTGVDLNGGSKDPSQQTPQLLLIPCPEGASLCPPPPVQYFNFASGVPLIGGFVIESEILVQSLSLALLDSKGTSVAQLITDSFDPPKRFQGLNKVSFTTVECKGCRLLLMLSSKSEDKFFGAGVNFGEGGTLIGNGSDDSELLETGPSGSSGGAAAESGKFLGCGLIQKHQGATSNFGWWLLLVLVTWLGPLRNRGRE